MPTPKPPYPAAFRQQMVELVRAGRGISDLAREFGCNASSIHAWMKAAGGPDGSGATSIDAPLSMNERQPRARPHLRQSIQRCSTLLSVPTSVQDTQCCLTPRSS